MPGEPENAPVEPASGDLGGLAAGLESRAGIYALLARLFHDEPTINLLKQLHATGFLDDLVEEPAIRARLSEPTPALVEELAEDFCKLFLGPGPHVAPMGSVHHPGDEVRGRMWGSTTQWLFRFVGDHRLKLEGPGYQGIPDQIFVELELCGRLVAAEACALGAEKPGRAERLRGSLGVLVEQHFLPWLEVFAERVEAFLPKLRGTAGRAYLGGLSRITLDLVRDEAQRVKEDVA